MRLLRILVVLVVLCLILGAPAASAAEGPVVPAGREFSIMARILLQDFLKTVWEYEGSDIDPLGRNSPGAGPSDDPAAPGADEGFEIDPLG